MTLDIVTWSSLSSDGNHAVNSDVTLEWQVAGGAAIGAIGACLLGTATLL